MYSGDNASWCLAHGWCVAVCMLLVRFHCYMSSLHPNYADGQCVMTGHTIHSSVTTCFKVTTEPLQPCKTGDLYTTLDLVYRHYLETILMQRFAITRVIVD